ncbi:MAG: hypothetical protein WDM78_21035 [Puia sp.]
MQANSVQQEQALETALYLGDQWSISQNCSLNAGIRYNVYNYLGPHDVYQYVPGQPREPFTIVDTVSYPKGNNHKNLCPP